ncbi:MAG: molybdopterin converting factor subunit 1 [Anaerolineales bacterium]|nr:molybdopterin converting factor subunit 1 [Anaerolineales bacterium]
MKVKVLYFASLRGKAGIKEEAATLSQGSSVAVLLDQLAGQRPEIAAHMNTVLVAINQEFAYPEDLLSDGDEVALFPPVSGGSGEGDFFALCEDPLDVDAISARLVTPQTGGVCAFTGYVRGRTERGEPHDTSFLEYEAYQPMAETKLTQIAAEMRARWPEVINIAIVQRTGRLEPGEASVLVACSAAHRDTGIFEAARYGIDRLKQIVPVWKKEVGPEGETWVEGDYIPGEADRAT